MAKKTTETTTKFKVDISELKKELRDANRAIMLTNSEFKNSVAGMDDWRDSADGVSAKITQLTDVNKNYSKILEEVSKRYEDVVEEEGEESESAQNLKIRMNNLEAAIKGNKTAIDKYTRQLSDMESEADIAKNTADDLSDSFEDNRTVSQKLQDEIKDQKKQLNNLKTEYSDVALEQGKDSDAAKELQGKISLLNYELESNEKKLSDSAYAAENFSDNIKDADGLANNVSNATENLSDNIKKVDDTASNSASGGISSFKIALGKLAADGISAIIGALKDMVTELVNVEGVYDNFQIQTGASTAEMGKFQTQIDDIYKSGAGESIEDISSAMANVAQNTKEVDPSKIKDLTENAITLRDSFGFDVQESMRAVNMLMDQFGITGEEAFNLIVQGAQNGLDKNGDLLDSINEYAVHYKQLGYDADDFFNSLANGTEAGTFSVDKLGDAMKEFGIRTKDTATSTVEGFELLGYSSGAAAEEISKTQTEIEKLEKNLQYAQMEQEGFNEKTSELTRLKNAEKIEEYSVALEDAKSRLSDLKTESNDSRGSIQALQDKFAEGGEAAQAATREVLAALFEMDDKVKQNQAGVDLFGTMWEDLGIEGVKALMDTNGELTASKESMEEITKIKYDNVTTEIASIGRTFKTDVLAPIVQKALPSIKKALEWVTDNLDDLVSYGKTIATAMATAFAVKKVIKFGSTVVKTIKEIKTATTAFKLSSVAGIVETAISGIIGGVVSLGLKYKELSDEHAAAMEEMREKARNLTEAQQEQRDALQETAEEWNNLQESSKTSAQSADQRVKDLSESLLELVNADGTIKKGSEEKVTGIIDEINSLTGSCLGLSDNLITKNDEVLGSYDKLEQSLDNIIQKNTVLSYIDAYKDQYETALDEKLDRAKDVADAMYAIETEIGKREAAQREFSEGYRLHQSGAASHASWDYYAQLTEMQNTISDSLAREKELRKSLIVAETNQAEQNSMMDSYSTLVALAEQENYEEADKIIQKLNHGFIDAASAPVEVLREQYKAANEEYAELKALRQKNSKAVSEEMLEDARTYRDLTKNEYELAVEGVAESINNGKPLVNSASNSLGEEMLNAYTDSLKKNLYLAYDAATDVSDETKEALKSLDPKDIGRWIDQGVADGIIDNQWKVQNAAAAVSSGVDAMIRNIFGIASPSKVMKKYGGFIAEGLSIGISNGVKDVVKSAKNMSNKALSALKTDLNINGIASNLSGVANQLNGKADGIRSSGNIINNYTFNQTNNSPKALSNFDIYRQSKNLLNAKGV